MPFEGCSLKTDVANVKLDRRQQTIFLFTKTKPFCSGISYSQFLDCSEFFRV